MKDDSGVKSTAEGGSASANVIGNYNTVHQISYNAPSSTLGVPIVNNLRGVTKRVASDDATLPYAMDITFQTDVDVQPVAFAIECSGPIGKIFLASHIPVMMSSFFGVLHPVDHPNVGTVQFAFPALTANAPLVVRVLSENDIVVRQILKIV